MPTIDLTLRQLVQIPALHLRARFVRSGRNAQWRSTPGMWPTDLRAMAYPEV